MKGVALTLRAEGIGDEEIAEAEELEGSCSCEGELIHIIEGCIDNKSSLVDNEP